jgi:hypothetical protein
VQSTVWSATTRANFSTDAWFVLFGIGNVASLDKKFDIFHAWCVRGGPGVDPQ